MGRPHGLGCVVLLNGGGSPPARKDERRANIASSSNDLGGAIAELPRGPKAGAHRNDSSVDIFYSERPDAQAGTRN